jgi:hypothetical protein
MFMSVDSPQVTTVLVSLTPEQAAHYEKIKRLVAELVNEPDGLMFALNALAQTGDSALTMMSLWSDAILSEGWDSRDLVGIIFERPLSLPHLEL